MVKTLQQYRDERVDCIQKGRDCKLRFETAGSKSVDDWTPAQKEEFNALMAGAKAADDAYKAHLALHQDAASLNDMLEANDRPEGDKNRQTDTNAPGGGSKIVSWKSKLYGLHPERIWEPSQKVGDGIQGAIAPGTAAYNKVFNKWLRGSSSAEAQMASTGMSSDNEERGGYFITSESFMSEIIKNVDDATFVQGLSRVIMMPPARSLGVRVRRSRASTFAWAGENTDTSPTLDTSLKYGKRYLTPHYLQGSTAISRDLLRNVPNSESMVVGEIGVDLNYKLEPAFLTGDGNQKPLGLMVAHVDGIPTSQDVVSKGAASTFTFDDFSIMKYSLKGQYRNRATWMLHRNVLSATALLKDGMGQYLWQPSRQIGFPDVILGSPVVETEWMPSAVTSGMYYALFADFSYYWIVYEMGMEMQRLVELRARTNEVEYLFRLKLDAQPVLAEAFVRGQRN